MSAKVGEDHIALVVEGRGDHGAVPVVLRRYLQSMGVYQDILGSPVNAKGIGNVTRTGGIEGFVGAVGNRPGCKGVLVVLDTDDNLVCELGPQLTSRVNEICECPVVVALADRDFEDWLYASAETLDLNLTWAEPSRGSSKIADAYKPRAYTKPVDQPRLAYRLDFDIARSRSPSLHRMLEKFEVLVAGLDLK